MQKYCLMFLSEYLLLKPRYYTDLHSHWLLVKSLDSACQMSNGNYTYSLAKFCLAFVMYFFYIFWCFVSKKQTKNSNFYCNTIAKGSVSGTLVTFKFSCHVLVQVVVLGCAKTGDFQSGSYRSDTVNLKSFVGKDFLRIKWKFELKYTL